MNNSGFTIVGYTLLVIYWCVRGRGGYFDDGVMIEFCIRSVNDWLMITFDHHITKHNTLFFVAFKSEPMSTIAGDTIDTHENIE